LEVTFVFSSSLREFADPAEGSVLSIDARNGRELWRRRICAIARNDDTYASPVVAGGVVLFGIDVLGDRPTDRDALITLDAGTGVPRLAVRSCRLRRHRLGDLRNRRVDLLRGTVLVGTGNPTPRGTPPPSPDPSSESIVALDLRGGAVRWAFGPVRPHDPLDRDFFSSPNRFRTQRRRLVRLAPRSGDQLRRREIRA